MIIGLIAYLIHSGTRFSGQKSILGPKNKVNWKIRSKLWVSKFRCRVTIFKISKNENTKITKIHDIWAHRMFNLVRISIFWSKSNPGTKKRIELKNSEQTLIFGREKSIFFLIFWVPLGSYRFSRLPWTPKINFTKKFVISFTIFLTMNTLIFLRKNSRKLGNLEWDDLGISSETTMGGVAALWQRRYAPLPERCDTCILAT